MEDRNDMPNGLTEEAIYQNALILIGGALYAEAAAEFARIPDYKDAREQQRFCEEKAANAYNDAIYADADKAAANQNIKSQQKAIQLFSRIPGYRDADARILEAEAKIEELRILEQEQREEGIRRAEALRIKTKKRRKRLLIAAVITVAIVAVGLTAGYLYKKYAVPEIRYRQAISLVEAGDDDAGYAALHNMNYRDSSSQVYRIAKDRLKGAEVGSTVLFGSFPQGSRKDAVKTPVEWIVLDKDGSKRLLISKYVLLSLPYMNLSPDVTSVTWGTSFVRSWLNKEFVEYTFDAGERRFLLRMLVTADQNPNYPADNGMDTMDRVFLLSIPEVLKYFPADEDRLCYATQFAIENGAYQSSIGKASWWWLRTMGIPSQVLDTDEIAAYSDIRAAGVGTSGEIIEIGHEVYNYGYGVRPVIWIDLDAPEIPSLPVRQTNE